MCKQSFCPYQNQPQVPNSKCLLPTKCQSTILDQFLPILGTNNTVCNSFLYMKKGDPRDVSVINIRSYFPSPYYFSPVLSEPINGRCDDNENKKNDSKTPENFVLYFLNAI